MAISMSTAAYGAVLLGGVTLFAIGHPAGAPPPSPTTPGLVSAAPPPAAPARSVTVAGFTLTSLAVALPVSGRTFPPGAGMEVVQQNCTGCHSVAMVMNQPTPSAATWDAEVHKMVVTYKAPLVLAEVPTIVAYLAGINGAGR